MANSRLAATAQGHGHQDNEIEQHGELFIGPFSAVERLHGHQPTKLALGPTDPGQNVGPRLGIGIEKHQEIARAGLAGLVNGPVLASPAGRGGGHGSRVRPQLPGRLRRWRHWSDHRPRAHPGAGGSAASGQPGDGAGCGLHCGSGSTPTASAQKPGPRPGSPGVIRGKRKQKNHPSSQLTSNEMANRSTAKRW